MPLDAGSRLGPYEILHLLGKGGMGEVYRARDTRLGRSVAIKILPEELARDPQRNSRFEREAMTVASLAHPNICMLHDVGRHDHIAFLVMELLDGTTLDERLRRGPLKTPEALDYAIQIVEALEAAHRKEIIHRDLKPSNVMLTPSGVKLLDFGLASLGNAEMPSEEKPTRTTPLTGQRQILGTLPYMAPEQLEGKPADARTDLFAFGAVLHEMLTGRRAFAGESQAGVIGAILHTPPPALRSLRPDAPASLEHLVSRCLSKDPEGRWSTAHDVLITLRWIADSPSSPEAPAVRSAARPSRLAWGLALSALGARLADPGCGVAGRAGIRPSG
ncbi:MAG TPA: serine/threonine-protein kinase [Candidatus Polarisedimenticolia bacterium]|jgi:serine/threonine protein kinase